MCRSCSMFVTEGISWRKRRLTGGKYRTCYNHVNCSKTNYSSNQTNFSENEIKRSLIQFNSLLARVFIQMKWIQECAQESFFKKL